MIRWWPLLWLAGCEALPYVAVEGVRIDPEDPMVGETLTASLVVAEGETLPDDLEVVWAWRRDGVGVPDLTGRKVPGEQVGRFQKWTVSALVEGTIDAHFATVSVANAEPEVLVRLPTVDAHTDLEAFVDVSDADGDDVSYDVVWRQGQVIQTDLEGQLVVSRELTRRYQTWEVTVTARDGNGGVSQASAATEIVNSPPQILDVSIIPSRPQPGEPLTASVTLYDLDGEAVFLDHHWFRNGRRVDGDSERFPPTLVQDGDVIAVEVFADDSDDVVGPVRSDDVVVRAL